ncbi:HIT domain-containing protein [Geomonas paludis]|uniref:HIT domain-containing protein n=1 Tax=Geomonas paludis TaxID=2740185 RepID=A0A6V8N031_9BACT|nr:HIT domain-containing protein [Geomonas paludis]UPU37317.1 HIT domain-containing protein [Geomonas paludis]GFO65217.1 hydrolase [Geomonas paludis]
MDRLWAPWRVEYLTRPPAPGCIFCAEGDDRDLLVIHRTPLARVMLNRYPYCNGHLLVSLHRHTAELGELSGAEMQELFRLVALCKDVLVRSSSPDGFNIGMNLGKAAGAGVEDHLHLHVVPRWSGDSNFMSVVADLRVLPEALLATYDRLLPFFAKAEGA